MTNEKLLRQQKIDTKKKFLLKLETIYVKQTTHKPVWQKDFQFTDYEKKEIYKRQLLERIQNMYQLTVKGKQYYYYLRLTLGLGVSSLGNQIYSLYEVLYHFPNITATEWAKKTNYLKEQIYQFTGREHHKHHIIKKKGKQHNSPWTYSLSPHAQKLFRQYIEASGQGNKNGR